MIILNYRNFMVIGRINCSHWLPIHQTVPNATEIADMGQITRHVVGFHVPGVVSHDRLCMMPHPSIA